MEGLERGLLFSLDSPFLEPSPQIEELVIEVVSVLSELTQNDIDLIFKSAVSELALEGETVNSLFNNLSLEGVTFELNL